MHGKDLLNEYVLTPTHVKITLNLDSNKFPKIGISQVRIDLEFESKDPDIYFSLFGFFVPE